MAAENVPSLGDVLVNEDFSSMTAGSEDFPEMSVQIYAPTYPPVIDSQYTNDPGWEGDGVYQAGGCVYFNSDTFHYLQTPSLDLSANSGCATVYFRARAFSGTTTLMAGNTSYGAPNFKSFYSFPLGTSWQELSFTTVLGEDSEIVQFQAMNALIDDVRVVVEGLPAPKALPCVAYNYTSALARWEPVPEADSYNLYFYCLSTVTWEFEIQQVYRGLTSTEFFLNNLDRKSNYGYQVSCVAGGRESALSNWIDLRSEIDEIKALPCSDFAGDSFTANWQPDAKAKSYNVSIYVDQWDKGFADWIYRQRGTLTAPEGASSLHIENIGLDPDSTYYYTVQAVDQFGVESTRSDYIAVLPERIESAVALDPSDLSAKGFTANWQGSQWANAYFVDLFCTYSSEQGAMIDIAHGDFSATPGKTSTPQALFDTHTFTDDEFCYWSIMPLAASAKGLIGLDNTAQGLFGTSFLISPEIDLSGGEIAISFGAVGSNVSHAYVCTAQYENGRYNIDQYVKVDISDQLTEVSVTLPPTSAQSYIVVYTNQPGYLMFSHFNASITIAPGAQVAIPYAVRQTPADATSQSFEIADRPVARCFAYLVSAARITPRTTLRALPSNAVDVPLPASVSDMLFIPDAPSRYYDVNGRAVITPAHGQIYIQRQGNTATKIRF